MTSPKIKDIRRKLLTSIGCLAVVTILWHFKIPCIYRSVFGITCPGCGMTRALLAALRLDFPAAFSLHAMFWSVPVLFAYFLFDGKLFGKQADRIILFLIGLGFLANWITGPIFS